MNIKTKLSSLMYPPIALALLAACSSNDVLENNNETTTQGQTLTINATTGIDANTSRTIFTDGTTKVEANWSDKDNVVIVNGTSGNVAGPATFTVAPQTDAHYATLTGSVSSITAGDVVSGYIINDYIKADNLSNSNQLVSVDYSKQKGTFKDAMAHCLQFGTAKYTEGDNIPNMSFDYKTTFFELTLTFPENLSSTVQLSMSGNGLVGKSYVNTIENAGTFNTAANLAGNINISDVKVTDSKAKVWVAMQPATLSNVVITAVDANDQYYKFDVSGKNSATLVAGKVYAFGITGTASTIEESLIGNGKNEANAYQISTLKQLEYVRNQINNANTAFTGKYYKLMSDIEINGEWTPIGINIDKGTKLFKGIFDGGNHSITGSYTVTNNANNEGAGLFGTISNATIKNLNNKANITVTSTLTSGTLGIGAIVGRALYGSTIENCSNTGTITTNYGLIGGVVGQVYVNTVSGTAKEAKVEACWNAGIVNNEWNADATKSAGGVIGYIQISAVNVIDKVIIRGCYSKANANITQYTQTKSFAGGIVGNTNSTTENVIEIYACWSAASLKGNYMASIIASYSKNKYSVSNIWFKTVKGVNACSVAANLKEPYSNSNTDTPSADAITYMNNALSSTESAYQFDADGNITKK